MAKNKTTENNLSVQDFIETVTDPIKKADSYMLVQIMEETTGLKAKMWGTAIIGFGSYHYRYESGREGDAPMVAFSPRVNAIALYIGASPTVRAALLAKFGKHKTSKSCIYFKKLSDIDIDTLKEMISISLQYVKQKYPQD